MPSKDEYWRNPAKFRARTRQYQLEHPEWTRESKKQFMRRKRVRLGNARNDAQNRHRDRDPVRYLLQHAKTRAKKYGHPFSLSAADIEMPDVCPVFGWPFKWGEGKMGWRNMYAPSLDRIKPQLGYVPGNVMVISVRANHLKANGTLWEMRRVLAYMERVGCNEDHPYEAIAPDTPEASPQLSFEGW